LHLANLVRLPTGIAAFDRIEFDAKIRQIDVINDIAFLVMDLFAKGRSDLGFLFLNRYLELTGDYNSVSLFKLYFIYRCLVRAKVMAIRCGECHDSDDAEKHIVELHRYLDLAAAQSVKRTPVLIVMHGLSGSGKTWLSGQLMGELPAVRVRSDIERKRIHGLAETAASVSGVGKGLYTDSANEDVYTTLCLIAKSVLRAGHDVILDASFLEFRQRERARQTAIDCGAEFLLIEAKASNETLRDRIQQRVERTSYCRFVESLYSHASRRALLTQSQDSQAHRLTLWFARAFWAPT
jgi:predicted kinase